MANRLCNNSLISCRSCYYAPPHPTFSEWRRNNSYKKWLFTGVFCAISVSIFCDDVYLTSHTVLRGQVLSTTFKSEETTKQCLWYFTTAQLVHKNEGWRQPGWEAVDPFWSVSCKPAGNLAHWGAMSRTHSFPAHISCWSSYCPLLLSSPTHKIRVEVAMSSGQGPTLKAKVCWFMVGISCNLWLNFGVN